MYEAFYGLTEKPFNLTPDPRFLYLSKKHKEAFAHLLYGIRDRCGFVMISGEIGTGKTTICRSLLKQLDPDTLVAFIFNPKLSPIELLKTINSDFGIASTADTVRGLIGELNDFLLEKSAENKNCVLIIDEAQNLGTETLEQIRLLSNLETETKKLLQIVLIGQPELAEQLELTELRQLNQRITARYHLGPLTQDETLHYIAFRLRVAGGRKKIRFTRRAVRAVYKVSRGTPRVINALCDRALLIGYTKETHVISRGVVLQAAREVHGDFHPRKRALGVRRILPASAFATAAFVVGLSYLLFNGPPAFDRWFAAPHGAVVHQAGAPAASVGDRSGGVSESPTDGFAPDASADADPEPEPLPKSSNIAEAAIRAESVPDADGDANGGTAGIDAETAAEASDDVVVGAAGINRAANALLETWGVAPVSDLPRAASGFGVRKFFREHGLRAAAVPSNIDDLLVVNLPVVLRAEREGVPEWVVWVATVEEQARLIHPDGTEVLVPMDALRGMYAGETICVWNDPAPATPILRAMAKGEAVRELQEALRDLGLLDRAPSGVYDAPTVDAVSKIQEASGLTTDGIYGPNTRMVLTSWLSAEDTPHLAAEAFSERARARVLGAEGMVAGEKVAIEGVSARSAPSPAGESLRSSGPEDEATPPRSESAGVEHASIQDAGFVRAPEARSDAVGVETLDAPAYEPLLDDVALGSRRTITDPTGPVVPIVPRASTRVGEDALR